MPLCLLPAFFAGSIRRHPSDGLADPEFPVHAGRPGVDLLFSALISSLNSIIPRTRAALLTLAPFASITRIVGASRMCAISQVDARLDTPPSPS